MVMVTAHGQNYYMDGYLQTNLDTAKAVIKKDWDFVFLVTGIEGGGKSCLAQQMAAYAGEKWGLNHIAFTPTGFKKAILNAPKYSSVVYDEAFRGLNARGTLTQTNITIVSMLTEIRQRNLFVFIVLPTFFDLDRYPALHRSVALCHVYTGNDFQRGFFAFYNRERKQELYLKGKKLYSYKDPRPNFTGRFTNTYTVPESDYRKLKENAVKRYDQSSDYLLDSPGLHEALLKRMLSVNSKLKHPLEQQDMAKILNLNPYYVSQLKTKIQRDSDSDPKLE